VALQGSVVPQVLVVLQVLVDLQVGLVLQVGVVLQVVEALQWWWWLVSRRSLFRSPWLLCIPQVSHTVLGHGASLGMFPPTVPANKSSSKKFTTKMDPIKLDDTTGFSGAGISNSVLIEMEVDHCLKQDFEGTLEDFRAQSSILQSCTDEYLVQISHLTSAYSMWQYLIDLFTE